MNFKIRQSTGYFLLDYSGKVDLNTIVSAYSLLLKEEGFTKESHTLWDFRKATVDLSIEDIQQIAEAVTLSGEQRSHSARSAFIVSDPSDKTIIQTYVTATALYPVEFEIFDDFQSGKTWLFED